MIDHLTSFTDYNKASVDTQIEWIQTLELESIALRAFNGESILNLNEDDLNKLELFLKKKTVVVLDPLLKTYSIHDKDSVDAYSKSLEGILSISKRLGVKNILYKIPKHEDIIKDAQMMVDQMREHIKLIRKHKIGVWVQMSDHHQPNVYKYIFELLDDVKVKMMYDPTYIFLEKEAEVTAYRLLRDYIGVLRIDDCDPTGAGRLVGKGGFVRINEISKRLIKKDYRGTVILDSSLIELILQAKSFNWFDRNLSKTKKHHYKIYQDFIELKLKPEVLDMIHIQLSVLSIMFLNKPRVYKGETIK